MSKKQEEYGPIDATPVKSFFVEMLTRDISLEDSILDLLDNCVDGIIRSLSNVQNTKKPYLGYSAEIEFSKDSFCIRDNCGGIPTRLHGYAFRMGRPSDRPSDLNEKGTVGVYGIGMKRAIFKMGKDCTITTKHGDNAYSVRFSPEWIRNEKDWNIHPTRAEMKIEGTTIQIDDLYPGTASLFGNDSGPFSNSLRDTIARQYALIIDKGFSIKVNGKSIEPVPTKLTYAKDDTRTAIRPYIFKSKIGEVDVFLTVGFTRPIPSENEIRNEQDNPKFSSLNAGWTIICNDRVVLYCDRSELTGWGITGIPRYHTQFIAIAGMVEFYSDDASKLPTTTTKRGIDASSPLYLRIRDRMQEGMRLFTDYTNKWKKKEAVSRKHFDVKTTELLSLAEIKEKADSLPLNSTKNEGKRYLPTLPKPRNVTDKSLCHVSFSIEKEKIQPVIDYLEMEQGSNASKVGKECFNAVFKEAMS